MNLKGVSQIISSIEISPRCYSNGVCQAPFLQSPCAEQNDKLGQAEKCLTLPIEHFGTSRNHFAKALWLIFVCKDKHVFTFCFITCFANISFSFKSHSQELQNDQHSSMDWEVVFVPAFHECSGALYHQSHHQYIIYCILFLLTGHTITKKIQRKYKVCCLTTDILPLCYQYEMLLWQHFLITHYQNKESHFFILSGKWLLCFKHNKNLSAQGNGAMEVSKRIFQLQHSKMIFSKVDVSLVTQINHIKHYLILLWES